LFLVVAEQMAISNQLKPSQIFSAPQLVHLAQQPMPVGIHIRTKLGKPENL
jgi:hypothetical protein